VGRVLETIFLGEIELLKILARSDVTFFTSSKSEDNDCPGIMVFGQPFFI
jgi:hypothetical protein